MSATLRYDVGVGLARTLWREVGGPDGATIFLDNPFGARRVSRWGGVGNPRTNVVTFAVKLPAQAGEAFRLLETLLCIRAHEYGTVSNSARALEKKLFLALGITAWVGTPGIEGEFMRAIQKEPSALGNWMAYADWLSEQGDAGMNRRGLVISGWLGKKAMKVKYGVPVLAKGEEP